MLAISLGAIMKTRHLVLVCLIEILLSRTLDAGEVLSMRHRCSCGCRLRLGYQAALEPPVLCMSRGAQASGRVCAFDTAELMRNGGNSGPAVVPRQSDESLIVDAVTGRDGWRMPPDKEGSPLSADEIAKLAAWIDQGARAPADERPQADPRDHWAFQPLKRVEVPAAAGPASGWIKNPIDGSSRAHHKEHGLRPVPLADPAILVRRVYSI